MFDLILVCGELSLLMDCRCLVVVGFSAVGVYKKVVSISDDDSSTRRSSNQTARSTGNESNVLGAEGAVETTIGNSRVQVFNISIYSVTEIILAMIDFTRKLFLVNSFFIIYLLFIII